MVKCVRTNSENTDFRNLVGKLDADLSIRDGEEHAFYNQYNKIDKIKYAIIALYENIPVGCGAIKEFSSDIMEVKRMYVLPEMRGRGIASIILKELEKWTVELHFKKCLLETGKKQPEAIQLYLKNSYRIVLNFGQYEGIENSVCFEKILI
jgi:GNAT superfamily N-acetyltransferase